MEAYEVKIELKKVCPEFKPECSNVASYLTKLINKDDELSVSEISVTRKE